MHHCTAAWQPAIAVKGTRVALLDQQHCANVDRQADAAGLGCFKGWYRYSKGKIHRVPNEHWHISKFGGRSPSLGQNPNISRLTLPIPSQVFPCQSPN